MFLCGVCRRKDAERRKKANAETRRQNREAMLQKKSEEELKEEIDRIRRLGQPHISARAAVCLEAQMED